MTPQYLQQFTVNLVVVHWYVNVCMNLCMSTCSCFRQHFSVSCILCQFSGIQFAVCLNNVQYCCHNLRPETEDVTFVIIKTSDNWQGVSQASSFAVGLGDFSFSVKCLFCLCLNVDQCLLWVEYFAT